MHGIYFTHKLLDFRRLKIYGLNKKRINKMIKALVGQAAAQPIEAIGNVFDQLFTSEEERKAAEIMMLKIAQQPQILQAEINKIEASHRSLFVAGWRPFTGWVCGIALAYHFILRDIVVLFIPPLALPNLEIETLTTVMFSLLGLGGLRTYEKLNGRSK